jgi:hypothetical protein
MEGILNKTKMKMTSWQGKQHKVWFLMVEASCGVDAQINGPFLWLVWFLQYPFVPMSFSQTHYLHFANGDLVLN